MHENHQVSFVALKEKQNSIRRIISTILTPRVNNLRSLHLTWFHSRNNCRINLTYSLHFSMGFSGEGKNAQRRSVARLIIYFALAPHGIFPRSFTSLISPCVRVIFHVPRVSLSPFPLAFLRDFPLRLPLFFVPSPPTCPIISPLWFLCFALVRLTHLLIPPALSFFFVSLSLSLSLSLRSLRADDTMNYLWIASRNKSNRSHSRDLTRYISVPINLSSRVTRGKEKWLILRRNDPENAVEFLCILSFFLFSVKFSSVCTSIDSVFLK